MCFTITSLFDLRVSHQTKPKQKQKKQKQKHNNKITTKTNQNNNANKKNNNHKTLSPKLPNAKRSQTTKTDPPTHPPMHVRVEGFGERRRDPCAENLFAPPHP